MRDSDFVYFLNTVPTIVQLDENRYVVFSKYSTEDTGPTTYFFCMESGVEVCRVKAAEAFIDSTVTINSEVMKFTFLSNRHLIENKADEGADKEAGFKAGWNWNKNLNRESGEDVITQMSTKLAIEDGKVFCVSIDLKALTEEVMVSGSKEHVHDVLELIVTDDET